MKKIMGLLSTLLLIYSSVYGAGISDVSIGGLADILEGGQSGQVLVGDGIGNVSVWTTVGSSIYRNVEDTLTDGNNIPDGAAIIAYGDANWGGGGSGYWTQNGTDLYYNTGNVGINQASPSYTLDVNGTIAGIGGVFSSDISATKLNTGHGANELYAMDQNVRTTDSPTFVSLDVGNGSDLALQEFRTGDAVGKYNMIDFKFGGVTKTRLNVYQDGASSWTTYFDYASGPMIFRPTIGGSPVIAFDASGDMGIGTSTPTSTSKLHIEGAGGVAGIYINDSVPSTVTNQLYSDGGTLYWNGGALGGAGSMVYPVAGIALSTGTAWGSSITNNSANWNTAYTDRLKWDGGSTDLVAATGRTSLGLGSASLRDAEDTLTDGANLPDGAAIKAYGDANWGPGVAGSWTLNGGDIYYVAGKVGVGVTSPDRSFHVEGGSAATSTELPVFRLSHITSGTPAENFGVSIEYELETTPSHYEVVASQSASVIDTTLGAERGSLNFYTMYGGDPPAVRMKLTDAGLEVGGIISALGGNSNYWNLAYLRSSKLEDFSAAVDIVNDGNASWDQAYTDSLKWSGGSSGLNPLAGRASLGLSSSSAVSFGSLGLGTPLAVSNGGTGTNILADGGILLGSGAGAITAMPVLPNGYIIVGDGSGDPVSMGAFSAPNGTLRGQYGGLGISTIGWYNMVPKITSGVATYARIYDESDMYHDSASDLATQRSIKAYVDANAGTGGSPPFGTITSGTNNIANMIVGTGAVLSAAGGAIYSTHYKGNDNPTSVDFDNISGTTGNIQLQISTIVGGLGTVSSRDVEDIMTYGSDIPDGKAIIDYGNVYWSGGGGSMVYPGAGIPVSSGSSWSASVTNNSSNWNTAYTDRLKWNGGSSGLVASTGRTSLGLGSAATRNAEDTLTNGSNLPDGAAIKAYGDANWGGGGGSVPWVTPEDYGAVVDDGLDDTTAFAAAIAAAAVNGQVVQCSAGVYNFSGHFTITSGVHIKGVKAGNYFIDTVPNAATSMDGTVFVPAEILADSESTYFIEMESNSRISELAIYYEGQYTTNTTPKLYPWTLWTDGDVRGVQINDIAVYRAYKFLYSHGSSFTVTNVYGHIIKYGIWDTKGGDTNRFTNVHFQPVHSFGNQWVATDMWVWSTSNGTRAFYTGVGTGSGGPGNSWNKFTNCFAYGFETVFYVDTGVSGTVLDKCGGDFSKNPFYILGTKVILSNCQAVAGDRTITGTQTTAYHAFTLGNSSYKAYNVNMSNCEAWTCSGAGVYLRYSENVNISNQQVISWSLASDGGQWGAVHVSSSSTGTNVFATTINGLSTKSPGNNGASSVYCAGSANYMTVNGCALRGDGKTGTYGLRGTPTGAGLNYANLFIGCATNVSGTWTSSP